MIIVNKIQEFCSQSFQHIHEKYEKNQVEIIDCLTLENIIPWFVKQKSIYPNAYVGILMKFKAVKPVRKTISTIFRQKIFEDMNKRGYIQLLLDDEDREVLNQNEKMVFRYFEAEREDREISEQFGNNDIIRFE